jgi:hypothetical protein
MSFNLREHLIDTGVITQRGLTRRATYRHCPGCGLLLLAAQDMGHEIWCDPWPITAKGELDALLAGAATYTRVLGELAWRDATRITFRDADHDDVFSEHRCGIAQPEMNHSRVTKYTRPDYSAAPPF